MERAAPTRIGLYLAVVQFVFTLTWTVYVIYLPKLAAQAGIDKQWVVFILLLDQIVFVVMDYTMGVAADRISRALGRLGYFILGITLVSCVAFLLLPYAAPQGAAWLFLLLTLLWTVSSSALRAPPLVLIGKYAAQPTVPWLSALSLFGLGLASAVSPYLTITLRDVDPRLPFVISSIALALATAGIIWAERNLVKEAPPPAAEDAAKKPLPPVIWFFLAVLLVGLGFQIHFSLNSAALFLRQAKPDQLQYLMPVFWIGFNVFMLPASLATKRYGGVAVAAAGALVAAIASLAAVRAGSLETLIAFQFIAGGGWGCVLMSVVSAAIAVGHTGREGKLTGGLFSLLALAAFARIAILAAELNKDPALSAWFTWLPVAAWTAGGIILLWLVKNHRNTLAAAPA
jgi:MFS family permease